MGWRDELQPASFRGVEFKVESESRTSGRRNVLHVLPGRDKGIVEDMGQVVNQPITFQAYVIGPGFMAQRARLVEALNAGGVGVLVHPLYGTINVNADECEHSTSSREGGMATFSLKFIEEGADADPGVSADSGSVVVASADALSVVSGSRLASRLAITSPSLHASALADLNASLETMTAQVTGAGALAFRDVAAFGRDVQRFQRDLSALLYTPAVLFSRLSVILNNITDLSILGALGKAFCGLVGSSDNAHELNRAWAQATLTAAGYASAQTVFVTYDAADAWRQGFADSADVEGDQASPEAYAALLDLSGAVWTDIDARAATLARVVSFAVPSPRSSLELAQALYGDATRAAEISERNGVLHPGFCFGSLSVLSE